MNLHFLSNSECIIYSFLSFLLSNKKKIQLKYSKIVLKYSKIVLKYSKISLKYSKIALKYSKIALKYSTKNKY